MRSEGHYETPKLTPNLPVLSIAALISDQVQYDLGLIEMSVQAGLSKAKSYLIYALIAAAGIFAIVLYLVFDIPFA
ncbi:MAG: hypothetical protein ACREBU_16875 [Nitrososphaera sp.]